MQWAIIKTNPIHFALNPVPGQDDVGGGGLAGNYL
jgi:hypothetical protein